MTYIFGARCKDGVVITADRKVTIGNTGRYKYQPKLFLNYYPMVWGSSGVQSFSDSFNNRVNVEIQSRLERRKKEGLSEVTTIGDFRIIVEEVYEELARLYGDAVRYGGLSVLMAQGAYERAELWLIAGIGAPQIQNGYVGIGSGASHAGLFVS